MSLLPQRKKSAEEIAKLRESLGIPGQQAGEEELPAEDLTVSRNELYTQEAVVLTTGVASPVRPELAPIPQVEMHVPKDVRSMKHSGRIPVLPVLDYESVDSVPLAHEPVPISATSPLPVQQGPKPVRSLRKSEQVPLAAPMRVSDPVDSKLPTYRHSGQEITELRRREALSLLATQAHPPPSLTAPIGIIIAGYLFAVIGATCFYFYKLQLPVTAICVAVSLGLAIYIFVRKPLSRHHAAFISVAALFVMVFGALHYFPNLQYGT